MPHFVVGPRVVLRVLFGATRRLGWLSAARQWHWLPVASGVEAHVESLRFRAIAIIGCLRHSSAGRA
eukprot:8953740-Lingulodinium_polyedra.AAC.1